MADQQMIMTLTLTMTDMMNGMTTIMVLVDMKMNVMNAVTCIKNQKIKNKNQKIQIRAFRSFFALK
jgi:hypothetical protein